MLTWIFMIVRIIFWSVLSLILSDFDLRECTVKLLEALTEDHRKYLETQFRTSQSFDLFVGVLFEPVESSISFASVLLNFISYLSSFCWKTRRIKMINIELLEIMVNLAIESWIFSLKKLNMRGIILIVVPYFHRESRGNFTVRDSEV